MYGRNSKPLSIVKRMNAVSNILTGKIIIGMFVPGLTRIIALFSVMYIQEDNITAMKPIKGKYRYGIVKSLFYRIN